MSAHALAPVLIVGLLLTGCGGSQATPSPDPTPVVAYTQADLDVCLADRYDWSYGRQRAYTNVQELNAKVEHREEFANSLEAAIEFATKHVDTFASKAAVKFRADELQATTATFRKPMTQDEYRTKAFAATKAAGALIYAGEGNCEQIREWLDANLTR